MLTELNKIEFHAVNGLFDDTIPNAVVARAVIMGHNPGKVWVYGDSNVVSCCLVIAQAGYALIYSGIQISNELGAQLIDTLKKNAPVKLVYSDHDLFYQQLIVSGFMPIPRVQLRHIDIENNHLEHINLICAQLPDDCEIKIIDYNILLQCHWLSLIKLCYGDDDQFLKHGFGVALLKNDKLISEAFSAYVDDKFVETASITKEEYRGMGYATIIRAFLIKEIVARHLMPITSCSIDNPASFNVSKKLGFVEDMYYEFLQLC